MFAHAFEYFQILKQYRNNIETQTHPLLDRYRLRTPKQQPTQNHHENVRHLIPTQPQAPEEAIATGQGWS
jgi:hypothetical protein